MSEPQICPRCLCRGKYDRAPRKGTLAVCTCGAPLNLDPEHGAQWMTRAEVEALSQTDDGLWILQTIVATVTDRENNEIRERIERLFAQREKLKEIATQALRLQADVNADLRRIFEGDEA